jgi:hypothetical protein
MTRQEAKELSLEVWRYLAEHPEIKGKEGLPTLLFNKIERLRLQCPLCEVFCVKVIKASGAYISCRGCPLAEGDRRCFDRGCVFHRWANSNRKGKASAREIVRLIEAWEAGE